MVSRPRRSAGFGWRTANIFVLIATTLSLSAGAAAAQSASKSLPFGLSAIFGQDKKPTPRTQILIDLRRQSAYEIYSTNNPNRVIVEMAQVGMRLPEVSDAAPDALVRHMRAGQYAPGRSRIVIDVNEPIVIEKHGITSNPTGRGAQLEILLSPYSALPQATKVALNNPRFSQLGGAFTQPPSPRRASGRQAGSAYKPLIVIDPGHGGKDSGARKFGVNEKDVVLAFGLTLRDRLLKTGRYRIKMTRETDVFIPLETRRDISEDSTAALFIAVHADYAGANARGATIYSLRREVADRLRRSAAAEAAEEAMSDSVLKHVKAKSDDLDAVRGILGDLAQREVHVNLERTNVFTQFAIAQMGATTTMRGKPHREAAFKVLKTAKVPSVLIELAYVSNRRDAARLQSPEWRNEVSASLVTAIEKYFAHSLSQIAQ